MRRDVMKRVLVIQMKRIGDVVLTAPALASLRRALPGVEVTLVLAGACGEAGGGVECGVDGSGGGWALGCGAGFHGE